MTNVFDSEPLQVASFFELTVTREEIEKTRWQLLDLFWFEHWKYRSFPVRTIVCKIDPDIEMLCHFRKIQVVL